MCRQRAKQTPGIPVTALGRPCRIGPECALNNNEQQQTGYRLNEAAREHPALL